MADCPATPDDETIVVDLAAKHASYTRSFETRALARCTDASVATDHADMSRSDEVDLTAAQRDDFVSIASALQLVQGEQAHCAYCDAGGTIAVRGGVSYDSTCNSACWKGATVVRFDGLSGLVAVANGWAPAP